MKKCTEKSSLTSKLVALIFSAFMLAFVWIERYNIKL